MGIIIVIVVVLIVIGTIGASQNSSPTTRTTSSTTTGETAPAGLTAVAVSANELFDAYQANEAAAQERYGDKPLLVGATVAGVDLDMFDKPEVLLRTPNEFMSAHAKLTAEQQPKAKTLSKGQKVKLLCGGVSEVVSVPMLSDCAIN